MFFSMLIALGTAGLGGCSHLETHKNFVSDDKKSVPAQKEIIFSEGYNSTDKVPLNRKLDKVSITLGTLLLVPAAVVLSTSPGSLWPIAALFIGAGGYEIHSGLGGY
jgi:hypothetical protein